MCIVYCVICVAIVGAKQILFIATVTFLLVRVSFLLIKTNRIYIVFGNLVHNMENQFI